MRWLGRVVLVMVLMVTVAVIVVLVTRRASTPPPSPPLSSSVVAENTRTVPLLPKEPPLLLPPPKEPPLLAPSPRLSIERCAAITIAATELPVVDDTITTTTDDTHTFPCVTCDARYRVQQHLQSPSPATATRLIDRVRAYQQNRPLPRLVDWLPVYHDYCRGLTTIDAVCNGQTLDHRTIVMLIFGHRPQVEVHSIDDDWERYLKRIDDTPTLMRPSHLLSRFDPKTDFIVYQAPPIEPFGALTRTKATNGQYLYRFP